MPTARNYADEFSGLMIDRCLVDQQHPSHQMLDRLEGALVDRAMAEEYLERLLDLVGSQRHPSLRMLDRVSRMLRLLAAADAMDERERRAA